jgi:dTDP-4-dehydrorhamnose 3,5-epimerase
VIEVEETKLDGVRIIQPRVFPDERGFFMETFNATDAANEGLPTVYMQDNHSLSAKGVLRGLHYQYPRWQGKLIRAASGEIYDVAVDIRKESPTYGEWLGVILSAENKLQMYVPEGFAHGFVVLSATADLIYKCTALFDPDQDCCLMWNDPDIGVEWPVNDPIVSEKDSKGQWFKDLRF